MVRKCLHCGKKFETDNKRKIFCSHNCAVMAYRHRAHSVGPKNPCKFVVTVNCTDGNCSQCGWNPKVEKMRKAVLGCG